MWGSALEERKLKIKIRHEMELAHCSRSKGNEGRARVCARRAAGWAVIPLRSDRSETDDLGSAYESLRWLQEQTTVSEAVRAAARRLTTRLTPAHELPFSQDPLLDAECVIRYVFGSSWRGFPKSSDPASASSGDVLI
jgi:hypothetical protein